MPAPATSQDFLELSKKSGILEKQVIDAYLEKLKAQSGLPGAPKDLALAMIRYPWRELGVHISFLGPRGGYLGRTFPQAGRIEMYVRPDETPTRV